MTTSRPGFRAAVRERSLGTDPAWTEASAGLAVLSKTSALPEDARRASPCGAGDILVVDDTPANLLAVEAVLGGLSSRVVRASSGQEALRQLLERDFALIVLDVQMPSMDGFETARLIRCRQRSSRTPIIFITAFDHSDADVTKAYELGAVDFLFKPVLPSVLRAKASVLLDLQRRTSEVALQAEQLRLAELREHERNLAEQRRRWEAEALERQMVDERRVAAELAKRADELAQTVAERVRAEQELKRINDELAGADRRKDEFLAVLAHELRNPLATIVASLELMSSYVKGDREPPLTRARDAMDRQVQHLVRLVDELLDVSRINSGKIQLTRERVELAEVVQSALATAAHDLEARGHRLELLLPDAPVVLFADPVRLTQVLANLLNNAAKYTDDGGRIRIRCDVEGGHAKIRVSDTGTGIAGDFVPHVFEMFVQERPGNGGLGIGLSLVKRLVELHGGSVCARSEGPGKGSEFEVVLPILAEPARPSPTRPRKSQEQSAVGTLRVVLVDDNTDIQDTLGDLLRAWGHSVSVATDGRRGVELILEERPDLAIVDIELPGMNGYEVARTVRSVLGGCSTRLVAMSGYGQEQDRERALRAGFDLHLVKPASGAALNTVIRDTSAARESGYEKISGHQPTSG